jgi:hypothetical protein
MIRFFMKIPKIQKIKKVRDIPIPNRDVTYQALPGWNNFIIPAQEEFGK